MAPPTMVCPPQTGTAATVARPVSADRAKPRDPRLPTSGSAIVRHYKGNKHRVVVLDDGFEYEGERYRTLTAVAKAITDSHINGYRFFRLGTQR